MSARLFRVVTAILAVATAWPGALFAQDAPLSLTLFRTHAAEGVTTVDAVAEIAPAGLRSGDACSYTVAVTISGAAGGEVARDGWRRSIACPATTDSAMRVIDTFSFGIRGGRHTVEMEVSSQAGEARHVARETVDPLPAQTLLSDLYLAREVAWDTTSNVNWPLRKGGIGMAIESVVDVPADQPFLGYYVELYADGGPRGAGTIEGLIRRAGQTTQLAGFTLQRLDTLTRSLPVAGTVSLAGLPPGDYEFEIAARFGEGATQSRSRAFSVRERAVTPAQTAAAGQAGMMRDYFQQLSDEALARFDAVVLWMESGQAQTTYASLSPDGKREFLAGLFSSIAPPGAPDQTGVDAVRLYLARAAQVEREFAPRQGDAMSGWRSDRGRLWMKHGPPADRIARPFPGNNTRPYEIWYYNVGAGYVYLFSDEGGFGNYRLLYTTDPSESTVPGWQRRAGIDAIRELSTYYGIQTPN